LKLDDFIQKVPCEATYGKILLKMMLEVIGFFVCNHSLYETVESLVVALYELIQIRDARNPFFDLLPEVFIVEHQRQGCQAYQS
jgi:hypothetical protein